MSRRTGGYKPALAYYDQAIEIATHLGDRQRQSELAWGKASVYYGQLRYRSSIELSERALKLAEEIEHPEFASLALTLIGKNYLALGERESASSALEQSDRER